MKQLVKWLLKSAIIGCFFFVVGCTKHTNPIESGPISSDGVSIVTEAESSEQSFDLTDDVASVLLRETEQGQVKGIAQDGVLTWYDLPYAAETAGEKRWTEPVDPLPWKDVRDATQPQSIALQWDGTAVVGTESPQNVTIYRPDSDDEKLPVLVYIHGGDNVNGSGAELSGTSFVKQHNAIIVTVNYRLGVLGFNPLQALKTGTPEENAGNFALLDLHKALIWIQNNIAEFGGDATNVTVAGFGSGGRNVMAMLISPMFDGSFDRAIVLSGGMTLADERESQEYFAEAFAPLVVEDGIQPDVETAYHWLLSQDPAVETFFYSLSNERLVSVMNRPQMRMRDFPHLYQDGLVIPKTGFETSRYNAVPLLLVTGGNEFAITAHNDPYFAPHVMSGAIYNDPSVVAQYQFTNYHAGQLYRWFNVYEPAQQLHANYRSDLYTLEVNFGTQREEVGEPMGHYGAFQGNVLPLLDPQLDGWSTIIGEAYQSDGAQKLALLFQQIIFQFMLKGNPTSSLATDWEKWQSDQRNQSLVLDATKTHIVTKLQPALESDAALLQAIEQDEGIDPTAKNIILTQVMKGRWFSRSLDKIYSPITIEATIGKDLLARMSIPQSKEEEATSGTPSTQPPLLPLTSTDANAEIDSSSAATSSSPVSESSEHTSSFSSSVTDSASESEMSDSSSSTTQEP